MPLSFLSDGDAAHQKVWVWGGTVAALSGPLAMDIAGSIRNHDAAVTFMGGEKIVSRKLWGLL